MGERPYRTAVWRDTVLCKKRKKKTNCDIKKELVFSETDAEILQIP